MVGHLFPQAASIVIRDNGWGCSENSQATGALKWNISIGD